MNSFLGSILSAVMLKLLSLSLLTPVHMHCTKLLNKVCVEQCLEALVYACNEAQILIMCKMTREQITSNMQISVENM